MRGRSTKSPEQKIIARRRGQALTERALLMLLLVVLIVSSVAFFGVSATGIFNGINNAINGTTNASPTPVGTSNPGPTGNSNGTLIISDSAPTLGQTITLTGSGFEPLSPVRAVMHSGTPITLKTQNSDTNGNITMEVYIPPTIILGDHLITLEGTNPSHTPITLSSQPLTIGPNPIVGTAQIASGPFYSGNYHTVLYSFSTNAAGGFGDLVYSWTGPDGLTAADAAPSYTFTCSSLPGSVSLSVIDGMHHELRIDIPLPPCPASISAGASISTGPAYGDNYSTATYTLNSTATGGLAPLTSGWTGPGSWISTDTAPSPTFDCTSLPANVTYTATDANGQTGTSTLALVACTSAMSVTPQLGTVTYGGNYQTMTTTLDAQISGGQNPYLYAWTGPGNFTSTDATPSFTVDCSALPGTIQLTITDTAGKSASGSLDITSCTAALTGSPQIVSGPLYSGNYSSAVYNFALSSGGGVGNLTYAWTGPDAFSSTSDTPYYTFTCSALPGSVSLTTTDTAGKTNTDQLQIPACIHSISVTPQAGSQTYSNNYTTTTLALAAAVSGGQTPFTYAWSGPDGFSSTSATPSLTVDCTALPQTLDLTVSDGNAQSQAVTLDLAACAGVLSVQTSFGSPTYNGNYLSQTGTLAATISGGTAPLTAAWTGAYTSTVASPGNVTLTCSSQASSATLTVTDANQQSAASSVTIPACPGSFGVNASISSGPLFGGNYSTVTYTFGAAISGGSGTPSYAWTGPDVFSGSTQEASYTFSCNALPGDVSLTVTDDNGKTATSTLSLPACASALTVSASADGRTYSAGYATTTFNLSALVTGGQTPYATYTWSGPTGSTFSPSSSDTTPTITIPCSSLSSGGNIILNVSDQAGQIGGDTVSLTPCPTSINASITKTSGPLFSGNYSSVAYGFTGAASGGATPYTYAWSGPSGFTSSDQNPTYTFTCSDLTAGADVTLTVTDHNVKVGSTTYSLPACASALTAAVGHGVQTYANNYTTTTLALSSTVSGGNLPYTYSWSGPGGFTAATANPSITVACALLSADVTLNLSDNKGQTKSDTYTIPACASNLSVTASLTGITFNGNYLSKSGTLASTVTGGTGPLTYAWSGPGSYTAAVANPGSVTFTCSALPGTATLTVTDANNQSAAGSVTIAACSNTLVATATVTSGPLYDGNYSTATYIFNGTATGGAGSNGYTWTGPDGFTSNVATPSYTFNCTALGGPVSLTVKDANGVTANTTLDLTACNAPLSATTPTISSQTYTSNYNSTTINLASTVTGGDTPTQTWLTTATGGLSWSGETTTTPSLSLPCSDLTGGVQTVQIRVRDLSGQTIDSSTLTLAACPSAMTLAPYAGTPTYPDNYVTKNVTLVSGLTNGSATYHYAWTGTGSLSAFSSTLASPALSAACLSLPATVNLIVTDGNNQTVNSSVSISACAPGVTSAPAIASGPLYDGNYGTALYGFAAHAAGGTGSYTYAWSGPDAFSSTSDTPTFTFTCTDLVGGQVVSLIVTDTAAKSVTQTVSLPACIGALVTSATPGTRTYDTGYVHTTIPLTSSVTGGQTPYTPYLWTGPAGSTFSPSSSDTAPTVTIPCTSLTTGGSVILNVTDTHGQVGTATVSVTACPSAISATITKNSGPLYGGNYSTTTYSFTASATGGTNSYTYAWTGPSGFTSALANPSYPFNCTDLTNGSQVVTLVAKDVPNGQTGSQTYPLPACPSLPITATNPTLTSQTYTANYASTTLYLSTTVARGITPMTYNWNTTASGGVITWVGQTTSNTPNVAIPCADLTSGAQTITLTVTDSHGQYITPTAYTILACPGVVTATSPTITSQNPSGTNTVIELSSTVGGGSGTKTYAWTTTAVGGTITWSPAAKNSADQYVTIPCSDLTTGTKTITLTYSDLYSSVTPTPLTLGICPPATPQYPAVSNVTGTGVTVGWQYATGATSYLVTIGTQTCTTATQSCNITGLTMGTLYNTGTIVASNAGGNAPPAAVPAFTTNLYPSVPVGVNPHDAAITSNGAYVYVANSTGNTVSVIKTADGTVQTITMPANIYPLKVMMTADSSKAYVLGSAGVGIINTSTYAVTAFQIASNYGLVDMTISPDGASIYIINNMNNSPNTVLVYNTSGALQRTIAVGGNANKMTTGSGGTYVYVQNRNDGTISVVNTTSWAVSTIAGTAKYSDTNLVISGGYLYTMDSSYMYVINTSTNAVVKYSKTYLNILTIAVTPNGSYLYANAGGTTVAVYSTSTGAFVKNVVVPNYYGLAFTPDGTHAYVPSYTGGYVSIIPVP
jgi:hypothetical protein